MRTDSRFFLIALMLLVIISTGLMVCSKQDNSIIGSTAIALDFPEIYANSSADLHVKINNAIIGDDVVLSVAGLESGLVYSGFIEKDGVVTVRLFNTKSRNIDPVIQEWKVTVIRLKRR